MTPKRSSWENLVFLMFIVGVGSPLPQSQDGSPTKPDLVLLVGYNEKKKTPFKHPTRMAKRILVLKQGSSIAKKTALVPGVLGFTVPPVSSYLVQQLDLNSVSPPGLPPPYSKAYDLIFWALCMDPSAGRLSTRRSQTREEAVLHQGRG